MSAAVSGVLLAGGPAQAIPLPALPALPAPLNGSLGTPPAGKAELDKSFASLTKSLKKRLPGQIGLAVTPVGGNAPLRFGPLETARAWSTLKVPVAIAAERNHGQAVIAQEIKAIELSDNEAAGELWGLAGGGHRSVDHVTEVLREGRDVNTRIASEFDDPPSFPGHTPWALADQAIFAANLPCMAGTQEVMKHMGSVARNQQWGFARPRSGSAVTANVKGGWGPVSNATGKSVVRQLAVVNTMRGRFGVSIAATPTSGSFTDGTKMLNRVSDWFLRNADKFVAGDCPPTSTGPAAAPR